MIITLKKDYSEEESHNTIDICIFNGKLDAIVRRGNKQFNGLGYVGASDIKEAINLLIDALEQKTERGLSVHPHG